MNKIRRAFTIVLSLIMIFAICSCGSGSNNNNNNEPSGPGSDPVDPGTNNGSVQSYFPTSKMNEEKLLKVIEGFGADRLGRHSFITATAIQGLMNREEVRYYVNYEIIKEGVSSSQYWLDALVDEYELSIESIGFEEMIMDYIEAYGEDAGYILYDDLVDAAIGENHTRSITAAVNMCSIRGWIPIVKDLEDEAQALGLEMKLDVSDKNEVWVFDNFKDEFNNDILIQQRPMEIEGLPMVPLRDYAVANKYFIFYEAGTSASDIKFRTNVHQWAKPNMPILGWGPGDEGGHIGFASQYGQFPIPSDFSMNLSVFNADIFKVENLEQNEFVPIVPEEGKHYVAFGRSDGDNISVWANEFPLSSTDIGGAEGGFPMSWSIQPSLIDIAPGMMNIIYKNARETDYFIAPVSGHGYIYPSTYPKEQYSDWFKTLDYYLGRTDLHVVEILDIGKGDILDKNIANQYAQCENLLGGICLNGSRYAGGQGAVIWSENGKPFIAPRETLWTEQKELVAARINSYERDYTKIEGYTFVNLHPWSHSYQDVEWVVENLDENVVVVSPEQLLDMISKNVAKNDVTSLTPSGNPVVVPFDANNNKFLLDTEDWHGNVNQESNALAIQGTATKTYTLPNAENLVIEFQYQAVGGDSQMTVQIEMDGKVVDIARNLPVYKNEGLNSMYIPLDLYFDAYQGKEITLTIKTAVDTQKIRIDNVITATKEYADITSNGDKLVDNFETSIEDWGSTSFEKGAFVKLDNNMIMIDGSDGWTGLFNAHINNAVYKYIQLPDSDKLSFNLVLKATDTGTDVKVTLILDGEVIELTKGYQFISNYELLDINTVLEGYANAKALIIVQQKDSNRNNGIGEICYITKFAISDYAVNAEDNRFDVDLEDWTITSGNVSHSEGVVVFDGSSAIEKNYTFPSLMENFNFKPVFKFANIDSSMKVKLVVLDGTNVLYESEEVAPSDVVEFIIDNSADLFNKSLTIRLVVIGEETIELDQYLMETIWTVDVYNNQFEDNMEDWVSLSATGWENNKVYRDPNWPRLQFTYALNGSVTGSKTYTLLNTRNIVLEASIEGSGKLAGMLKYELVVDGTTYTIYEGQIAPGVNTVSIPLAEIEALAGVTYEGKEVTVLMTVKQMDGGAGDCWLWSFVTKEAEPTPTPDPEPEIPAYIYNNQFDTDMEDWIFVSATGWESNRVYKDPNWPRLQVTYALNGSVTASKTYTLLNTRNIVLEASIEGQGDLAGMLKYELVVDGTTYTIYDAQIAAGVNTVSISLAEVEALTGVAYEGKEVTVLMTVSQMDGGAGDCWFWSFVTKEVEPTPTPDPEPELPAYVYNNQFDTDMEDWVNVSATGWENNKAYKDPNWPRLQITYALNGSVTASKTYKLLDTRNIVLEASIEGQGDLAGMLKYELVVDGTTYTIYDAQIASGVNTVSISLADIEALAGIAYEGKEVTVLMTVTQMDGGAGDCWFWSFVTKEVDPTPTPDPEPELPAYVYNNQFDTDMEDWVNVSATGWENNKAYKDPNWPRLQITYALNGSVTASKTYKLLDTRNIVLEASIEGQGDLAGMLKYEIVVDDVTYTIYEDKIATGVNTVSIALAEIEALAGVAYEGKEVTVLMTVTQMEGGAGDCWLWSFATKEA